MNNIPAFPLYAQEQTTGHLSFQEGMTLLDYFAGQVLQAHVTSNAYNVNDGYIASTTYGEIAKVSYDIAAAMLTERQKHINQ